MARKKRSQAAKQVQNEMTVKRLLAKAISITSDIEESAALDQINAEEGMWGEAEAVLAPYDPRALLRFIEITPHLKPAIMSMAHNVDGWGYHCEVEEPWMSSSDDEEAVKAIVEALTVEAWVTEQEDRLAAEEAAGELEEKILQLKAKGSTDKTIRKYKRRLDALKQEQPDEGSEDDTEDYEQQARLLLAEIRVQLVRERYLFKSWFEHCCSDMSFVDLRKAVREDIESHGWGCIEWLRDKWGRLKRLQYIQAHTVRPLSDKGEFINVAEDDSVTPLSEDREVIIPKRFRIYLQQVGSKKVYFKQPRDPRIISRTTGKVYGSLEALQRPVDAKRPGEGRDAQTANELMWIPKHDPTTPCPPPDWIGNLLAVLGVREADETNYYYLNSNAIPSGLLFIHGGTVPKATRERLEHRMRHEVQGAENTGKILIVEAMPGGKAAPGEKTMLPSITFQSLREAHTNDALFTEYDKRSADRIGASFRLSPLLRGYTPSDLNRATAVAALYFAEQQVFAPSRQAFDWLINKEIMPELGLRFVSFESNSPPTTSPEELGNFVRAFAPHGAFTPTDLRSLAANTLNKELPTIDEDWADRPIQLTLNGITGGGTSPTGAEIAEVNARLRGIEDRVAMVVSEELRQVGLDYDVTARYVDQEEENGAVHEGPSGDQSGLS